MKVKLRKNQLAQVVLNSGLWDEGRDKTHAFVLSPQVHEFSVEQAQRLSSLGIHICKCLEGVGRIAAIGANKGLTYGQKWRFVNRLLQSGVPEWYTNLFAINPAAIPALLKVDFVEDRNGLHHVVEIDGHNTHGLGYQELFARMRRLTHPGATGFPGVAPFLAELISTRGGGRAAFVFADEERFYRPEFEILRASLHNLGVDLAVVQEAETEISETGLTAGGQELPPLLLNFPVMHHNQPVKTKLMELYGTGKIDFIIPPKPFHGSKNILGLLRNEEQDGEIESILRSQIPAESLGAVRACIPETHLVGNRHERDYWQDLQNQGGYVLKKAISSGMKGTLFQGDDGFDQAFDKACAAHGDYVLQRQVLHSRTVSYFDCGGGKETVAQSECYLRIIVHFAAFSGVADACITAKETRAVNGGKESKMFGSIVV